MIIERELSSQKTQKAVVLKAFDASVNDGAGGMAILKFYCIIMNMSCSG